ncbi:tRNA preQ1(34) S-adenosylmethionine ribosyltransferase-isomerase QueA [Rickettsiales endosymbiont of Peranema trichophorum]|uniref:tRNA preQ1(34) S-adenosylmethionine ribosyltransferase-isomerase QueA n=1 Tax=Rickettsiales endosymbiont of Peranema trichophorum TaxID=2486577 RepID=UPI001023DC66|nr:tRNA preQ1(34) S-adenosylmethionine ribosyltransferase-isomerase QueA [Rickettsiales endosymbiont of Peranema trichophorum]RZI47246.1 tRNA preQ1(34) S-adenosylmethionine ribosyltransferase-isomerase QueA [Rickettsiales endosymbiont of Peranema trichophorum]
MKLSDFDYHLPKELIAQTPLPRSRSRLLNVTDIMEDLHITDLPMYLSKGDVLVLNNTRVIPSLLRARKVSKFGDDVINDGIISFNLYKNVQGNVWLAFAKPGKKVRVGDTFAVNGKILLFQIIGKSQNSPEITIQFACQGDSLISQLKLYGDVPLPPYIKRSAPTEADTSDYQTVFASVDGAVAAPTAGLHFTTGMLEDIQAQGVRLAYITLHVGGGTFLPIRSEHITEHEMHEEAFLIPTDSAAIINDARANGNKVIAVGTTVLRTLEATADERGFLRGCHGSTNLFIYPGYRFKAVDMLLTNFHLPKSTLFILVCAFAGTERMKRAYLHAVQQKYRFFSYGDACFLRRYRQA